MVVWEGVKIIFDEGHLIATVRFNYPMATNKLTQVFLSVAQRYNRAISNNGQEPVSRGVKAKFTNTEQMFLQIC